MLLRRTAIHSHVFTAMTISLLLAPAVSGIEPILRETTEVGRRATADERFEYMKQSAEVYQMTDVLDGTTLELRPQPLTRWSNPISGIADGIVALWTYDGAPAVAAQVYLTRTNIWIHEFQSLTESSIEVAVKPSHEPIWKPARSVLRQPIANAPVPAATETRRLAQMKQISSRFAASVMFRPDVTKSNTVSYELRCLPRPIYRYRSERAKITDGALFAFVQGTNPEVFLILEVRGEDDDLQYCYGLSAMTGYEVSGTLDGNEIWNLPPQKRPWPIDGPYFSQHYQRAQ